MTKAPETIYLIIGEDVDGHIGYLWCDDPAPSPHHDPDEAVEYLRKDKHDEIIAHQAKAAKMGMDAAKKGAHVAERNARRMLAESNPEALESERAANAILTDRVETLENDRDQWRQQVGLICTTIPVSKVADASMTLGNLVDYFRALHKDADEARQIIAGLLEYAECNDPSNPHLGRAKGFLSGGEQ